MSKIRRIKILLLILPLLPILAAPPCLAASVSEAETRVIHVFVALCDNKYQWIAKVPKDLGNGQEPSKNLYWGAMYGLKTFFGRQKDWKLVARAKPEAPHILERLVFKSQTRNVYLVADAYDGKHIRDCIQDFMWAASGNLPVYVEAAGSAGKKTWLSAGGQAGLVCYVGHNGLMEFELRNYPQAANQQKRTAAAFACQSKKYFDKYLQRAGASRLALTTGNMAPEAYIVHALANAWAAGKPAAEIREAVAAAYHQYQKCGLNSARRLFTGE